MATYIWVGNFTEQGARSIKDTIKRADAVKEAGKKYGVTLKDMYWTMGAYDLVGIFEAPDAESISSFALTVGMAGNLQGQSMRAFTKDEMNKILAKVG